MKIITCYKLVPEEQDISVKSNKTLDFSAAQWKIGEFDLNAVEAAMRLIEASDGEVVALTAGTEIVENPKLKKAILSRGPAEMYGIKDEALATADSYAIAQTLKSGVEKIGGADLVMCGEGSGDIYARQVGSVLGALLGWPTVNAVSEVTVQDGKLIAMRSLESGVEVLEVALPAVVSVTTDINIPRIPGMKDILAAGKKPTAVWSLADVGVQVNSTTETLSILAPEQTDRQQIIVEGDNAESIEAFCGHLRKVL